MLRRQCTSDAKGGYASWTDRLRPWPAAQLRLPVDRGQRRAFVEKSSLEPGRQAAATMLLEFVRVQTGICTCRMCSCRSDMALCYSQCKGKRVEKDGSFQWRQQAAWAAQ